MHANAEVSRGARTRAHFVATLTATLTAKACGWGSIAMVFSAQQEAPKVTELLKMPEQPHLH